MGGGRGPAPREAPAAAARLEEAGAAWDEALAVIDEARKKQMAAPGLQEPAKKALATLDREWDGLAAHRDYPMIGLDNNPAERALRRPVVTRKNAYGSRNEDAARLAARVWTVTATAEMAGLNVSTYLTAYLDACGRNGGKPRRPGPGTVPALACQLPKTSAPGHSRQHPDNRTETATATASPRTRSRRPLACPITGFRILTIRAGQKSVCQSAGIQGKLPSQILPLIITGPGRVEVSVDTSPVPPGGDGLAIFYIDSTKVGSPAPDSSKAGTASSSR